MSQAVVKETWRQIQDELSVAVGEQRYRMFLKNTLLVQLNEQMAEVGVPNLILADYLEKEYASEILTCIKRVFGLRPAHLKFSVNGHLFRHYREKVAAEAPAPARPKEKSGKDAPGKRLPLGQDVAGGAMAEAALPGAKPSALEAPRARQIFRLNHRCRLEHFVVGPNNRLAFNCAVDVARSRRGKYNIMFIHGGCGLGKTHLLQGIATKAEESRSQRSSLYVSAEYFVNQYVGAVKARELEDFRARFRSLDLLLIDDVDFFQGKSKCQEELLHTLKTIETEGKQVVLAANLHPKSLRDFDKSLCSRFLQGMVAELKAPGVQTRMALIKAKLGAQRGHFADNAVHYLAAHLECNVREIEGCLTQILATAGLMKEPITISTLNVILGEFQSVRRRLVELTDVENEVIAHFGVSAASLHGRSRERSVARARQVCMYLARSLTQHSLKEIGRFFGGKNHSTVVFSNQKVEREMENAPELRAAVEHLKRQLLRQA